MVHNFDNVSQFAVLKSTARRPTNNRSLTAGLLSVSALIASITVCLASPANANRPTSPDTIFVRLADQAEIGDVRRAALALHKSDDPPVVSLATRIRDVDSQLHLELESIANAQHVSFPPATGSHYKRRLHELALESGSRFNVGYLKSQLRADEQILSVYKREVAKGANIYVAAFAKETIPVLDQHIWLARHGIASIAKRARPVARRTGM